ncbi:MAG: inositol monophosphatase [Chloroflexota bacterium]
MSRDLSQLAEPPETLAQRLLELQRRLRDAILSGRDGQDAAVVREAAGVGAPGDYSGDTIYRIDERGEAVLLEYCDGWAREVDRPFALVAEGLPGDGRIVLPFGSDSAEAAFECIVDPIDGTRGLMYDKRSAWALAAVAPGQAVLGRRPRLSDVVVAVQTEIPTSRARYVDALWAVAGSGCHGTTLDLATGAQRPWRPSPSLAGGLAHGFATVAKFFPGTKEAAAWLEERLFAEVVGDHAGGAPLVFDDQYISSGGQLYELMVGHDRFVADLRPDFMAARGLPLRLCARPYDLCTELIARESGVIVTDAWGAPLDPPLDTVTDVSWVGYANQRIRALVEPVLQRLLAEMGVVRVPAP